MVGKIILDDECKDCFAADLSVASLYSSVNTKVHYLHCSHENACRNMRTYCLKKQKQKEKEKDAL